MIKNLDYMRSFININKDVINAGDWDELFARVDMDYAQDLKIILKDSIVGDKTIDSMILGNSYNIHNASSGKLADARRLRQILQDNGCSWDKLDVDQGTNGEFVFTFHDFWCPLSYMWVDAKLSVDFLDLILKSGNIEFLEIYYNMGRMVKGSIRPELQIYFESIK